MGVRYKEGRRTGERRAQRRPECAAQAAHFASTRTNSHGISHYITAHLGVALGSAARRRVELKLIFFRFGPAFEATVKSLTEAINEKWQLNWRVSTILGSSIRGHPIACY